MYVFKFYFPLFWGLVMKDNEFETKENKINFNPRIKFIHNMPYSRKLTNIDAIFKKSH